MITPPVTLPRVRVDKHGGPIRIQGGAVVAFEALTVGQIIQQFHGVNDSLPDGWSQPMEVMSLPTAFGSHGNFSIFADLMTPESGALLTII